MGGHLPELHIFPDEVGQRARESERERVSWRGRGGRERLREIC